MSSAMLSHPPSCPLCHSFLALAVQLSPATRPIAGALASLMMKQVRGGGKAACLRVAPLPSERVVVRLLLKESCRRLLSVIPFHALACIHVCCSQVVVHSNTLCPACLLAVCHGGVPHCSVDDLLHECSARAMSIVLNPPILNE